MHHQLMYNLTRPGKILLMEQRTGCIPDKELGEDNIPYCKHILLFPAEKTPVSFNRLLGIEREDDLSKTAHRGVGVVPAPEDN